MKQASLGARVTVIVLAAAVVCGVLLQLVGFSPAFEVLAVLAIATLCFGQRFGWAMSVAASVLVLLFGNTLVLRLNPLIGVELGVTNGVALFLTGAALLVWITTRRSDVRLPTSSAISLAGAAVVVPAVTAVFFVARLGFGQHMQSAWMTGYGKDTVWNTVGSRLILSENGLAPWLSPNPSPLVNGLMATWYAPGRGTAAEVLRHDVARQNELLLLLILLCSVLAGIVVARAVPVRRPVLRFGAGMLGSIIPLSGYVAGYVIRFGFFNVAVAVAVLLCVWIVWTDLPRHLLPSVSLLLIATTVLLAAWAPLAALPMALAGVGCLLGWRTILHARRWSGSILILSATQLVLYVVLATLPDLKRDGAALAATGGVPEISQFDVVLIGLLAFLVGAVSSVGLAQRHEFLGLVIVLLGGSAVVAYLMLQRRGMGSMWEYYPVKLAWLISILLVVLITASVLRWLGHEGARNFNTIAIVLVAMALMGVTLKATSLNGLAGPRFPLITLAKMPVTSEQTARDNTLFATADNGEKTIHAAYSADPADDQFINFWLLQLSATRSADPIRSYAYSLDPTDAADVCAAAETWGDDVVVVTRSADFMTELHAICPAVTVRVAG